MHKKFISMMLVMMVSASVFASESYPEGIQDSIALPGPEPEGDIQRPIGLQGPRDIQGAIGLQGPQGESNDLMTEGQLLEILVNALGFDTMLPPNPSQADMIQVLMQNGIVPRDGWQPDRVVTLGNLARVLVQSLGQSDWMENPEDDASWVNYLLSVGLDLSTIDAAMQEVPSADPNAGYSDARSSFDPVRRYPFSQPFSGAGFTVQTFREIFSRPYPTVPPPPRPVTPN